MRLIITDQAVAARPSLRNLEFIPDEFFASGGRVTYDTMQNAIISHDNGHINALSTNPALHGLSQTRGTNDSIVVYGEAQQEEVITAEQEMADDFDVVQQHVVETAPTGRLGEVMMPGGHPLRDAIRTNITTPVPPPPDLVPPPAPAPTAGILNPSYNQNLLARDDDDRQLVRIAGVFNNEISTMARNVEALQKEFSELLSKAIKAKRKIEIATSPIAENPDIARLMESIAALRNHGKVEDVFIHRNDNTINVKTKTIITRDVILGGRRLVGKMLLVIPIKMFIGDTPNVDQLRIYNMTHLICTDGGGKWQAPHVLENGSSCYGDSMSLIVNAIVARDAVLVVDSIIQFLEQPNLNDMYGRCARLLPVMAEGQQ